MAKKRALTTKQIEAIKPPTDRPQQDHPDGVVPGLSLRVGKGGKKTFTLSRRFNGRMVRKTIGAFPDMTLGEARAAAAAMKELDHDPDEQEVRDAVGAVLTFGQLASLYFEDETFKKFDSGPKTRRTIERELLPYWRDTPIDQITLKDAVRRLDPILKRGAPSAANRLVSTISRVFNFAVEKAELPASPMTGLKKPAPLITRDRVLTDAELVTLWKIWDAMAFPFGRVCQLLLLTCSRRSEVAGMRWDELDLKAGVWEIPPERCKSDRAHKVHLTQRALDVLATVPRTESAFVFPAAGRVKPGAPGHFVGFSTLKARCDELSGVNDWRIHDLRRSAISGIAKLGTPPVVAQKLLNHSAGPVGGVLAVYLVHDYFDERREALEGWSSHLERILPSTASGSGSSIAVNA